MLEENRSSNSDSKSEQQSSPASPRTRIVVPAYDARRTIRRCVEAVRASEGLETFEVVVSDDGANGDLDALLAGLDVRIVSTGKSGSAAVARNRGAEAFAGDYLVFVDSDVVVARECLSQLLRPLLDGDAEASVGNYSHNVQGLSFAGKFKQIYIATTYDRFAGLIHNEFRTAIGAVKARNFFDLGGFDERFRGANGEDRDLGLRLSRVGGRVISVPNAVGDHLHDLDLGGLVGNDWNKAWMALHNINVSGTPLTDNPHSGRGEILAVAAAGGLAVLILMQLAYSPRLDLTGAAGAALFFAYVFLRFRHIRAFATHGVALLAAALPMLLFLDLLRGICVALFLVESAIRRLQGKNGPFAEARFRMPSKERHHN